MGEHSLHRKNRAEGKRNRGLGKTWPCHRGWIAGPPLTGLPKIPGCCEPQILRPSWPWQMGSLPFTSGLPACTAILVGGTKRPTRPPPPMLAIAGHHPLISFPHQLGSGSMDVCADWRSQNCASAFLPSLQPQPPRPHSHIRPALRAHNFKALLTFLGQNFIAFGQRPL